ncbi:hypothetical protein R5R35_004530 [Gryllus longicercus]|uniref:Uncharacterized protein n=1 Tax=Gryllus longicercus TaxID=2509291 RepID=A0AAN9W1K5_9ORTH
MSVAKKPSMATQHWAEGAGKKRMVAAGVDRRRRRANGPLSRSLLRVLPTPARAPTQPGPAVPSRTIVSHESRKFVCRQSGLGVGGHARRRSPPCHPNLLGIISLCFHSMLILPDSFNPYG